MTFYFGEKAGDPLMAKINLREISQLATRWEHPVRGLFKYAESMKGVGGDILKLPKKIRELYCLSLVAVALMDDSHLEWWTNVPEKDPPDGLIMTLVKYGNSGHMGHMRPVEVVEHRDKVESLLSTIRTKMTEYAYDPNSILTCLLLSTGIYDLKEISSKLKEIASPLSHVFVVFTGVAAQKFLPRDEDLQTTYTMVQLLPKYEQVTFNAKPYLDDFMDRWNKGQELRLIDGNNIYYGTTNQKFLRK